MHVRHLLRIFHVRYIYVLVSSLLPVLLLCDHFHVVDSVYCLCLFQYLLQPCGCTVPDVASVSDARATTAYYSSNASSTICPELSVSFAAHSIPSFMPLIFSWLHAAICRYF